MSFGLPLESNIPEEGQMTPLFMDNNYSNTSTGFSTCGKYYDDSSDDEHKASSDNELLDNTIRLKLKKPKTWNWELTTSKSSPNIAFPRILLYDEHGKILADAKDSDCVFKGSFKPDLDVQNHHQQQQPNLRESQSLSTLNTKNKSSITTTTTTLSSVKSKKKRRSSTTNLADINESLLDLVDQLETRGIAYKINNNNSHSHHNSRANSTERKLKRYGSFNSDSKNTILRDYLLHNDESLNTNEDNELSTTNTTPTTITSSCSKLEKLEEDVIPEIPIWIHSEKGLLMRDFNAKEFDHLRPIDTQNSTLSVYSTFEGSSSTSDLRKIDKSLTPTKGVRFDLQKSKSSIEVCSTENERRRPRRSNNTVPSTKSGSILERMIAFRKKCSSSTDSQDIEVTTVSHGPRYFLRTSNAGTLVVCEENWSNRKIRRRPRSITRISENDENDINSSRDKNIQKFEYPENYTSLETKIQINGMHRENGNGVTSEFYNKAITKLDNLISKVSLENPNYNNSNVFINSNDKSQKRKTKDNQDYITYNNNNNDNNNNSNNNSRQFLTVTEDFMNDFQRGQSTASDFKVKRRRKLKELRRCVSAGAVCLSSDDDDNIERNTSMNRNFKNRSKRRLCPKTPTTGDQILALNNSFSSIQPLGSSSVLPAAAGIIDETSDEILLRFVRRLESFKQQKNLQKDLKQPVNVIEKKEDEEQVAATAATVVNENKNYQHTEDEDNPIQLNKKDKLFKDLCNNNTGRERKRDEDEAENEDKSTRGSHRKDTRNNNNNNSRNVESLNEDVPKIQVSNGVSKDNDNRACKSCSYNLTSTIRTKGEDDFDDECALSKALSNVAHYTTNNEIGSDCNKENFLAASNMGSNVSRNTGKGLSGRRTQSSGNLYSNKNGEAFYQSSNCNSNDKKCPNNSNELNAVKYSTVDRRDIPGYPLESCPLNLTMPPLGVGRGTGGGGVTKEDRNKFCGSLPNHLDNDSDNTEKEINQNCVIFSGHPVESCIKSDRTEYVTVTPSRLRQHQQHQQNQQQQQQQYQNQQQQQQQQQHPQHPHHQHHQPIKQMQLSPYNNSISEKETASTSSEGSTFKINQDKPDIQLKLPLTRSNFDPSCDQGYGSERSPEDEVPPLLSHITPSPYLQQHTFITDMSFQNGNPYSYNFITKDCTFTVQITKGPRGLGLSISGGIDSNAAFPGLIRIKRLFPHQAAWSTGKLQPGDIILEANDVPLTGLTNYEALEVLRTMPSEVVLLVCRPNDEHYKKLSPPAEPPKPPQRTHQQGTQTMPEETYPLEPASPIQINFNGEFEIIMVKQQGSLGFTLRKEDESVLGHYVRALVREPATTDGRIKPGDKIVAVNDVPLSPMTHEQAVIFLRQAADTVKLRLYRDEAQTPVAAMSPTLSENKVVGGSRKKTCLRPEAINLLSDLAYKKQNTPCDSTESSLVSSSTSPRRLKRGNKHSSANTSQSEQDVTDSKGSSNTQYIVCSQTTSVCSDSEQSGASQCSFIIQPAENSDSDVLNTPDTERPNRPNFLNLSTQSGAIPTTSRKTKLQFSVPTNAYDLNNLDSEALDAPRFTEENDGEQPVNNQFPENHEFTSLPCETFLIACKTENDLKNETNFNYKNPMYQSDHIMVSQNDDLQDNATKRSGSKSLLKWKGVVFSPDEEEKETPGADSSCTSTVGTSSAPTTEQYLNLKELPSYPEGYKIITVELNRGWNSRLGFSLQTDQTSDKTEKTVIRAIYSDSVAARDGRLRVGDQLLMVNEESVEDMPTQDVIELLRLLRGSIAITVLRKNPETNTNSKNENA